MSLPCRDFSWVESIYDNKRVNRYPERACTREYNQAAPLPCCIKPSFLAQPFLRYTEPESYGEFREQELREAGPLLDKNGDPVRIDAQGEIVPLGGTVKRLPSECKDPGVSAYCCNNDGYGAYRTPPAPSCKPCAITLSCGNGWYGETCQPNEAFKRREYPVGVTHIPATSLPILTQYEWENPGGLYHYDSPEAMYKSYEGTYNGHLAAYAKFAFQTEAERLRLQYGIQPPFPPQLPGELPANVAPRYQLPRPLPADAAPAIPYNQKYLDLTSNCGCNKSTCSTCCNPAGTTCSNQVGENLPTPLATIYANGANWPCSGDYECGDSFSQWMSSRGAFCKGGCGSQGVPPNCPEKFGMPGSATSWGTQGSCL